MDKVSRYYIHKVFRKSIILSFGIISILAISFNQSDANNYPESTHKSFELLNHIMNAAPLPNPVPSFIVEGFYVDKKGLPMANMNVFYERNGKIMTDALTNEQGYFYMEVWAVGLVELDKQNSETILKQNNPNPFTQLTSIEVSIAEPGTFSIHNMQGRIVNSIELKAAGIYMITWGGSNQVPGIYIYSVTAGSKTISKKIISHGSGSAGLNIKNFQNSRHSIPVTTTLKVFTGDSIVFSGTNSSTIKYQFDLQGDTLIHQEGNPGPYEFQMIEDTTALEGDTLSWNILDYVYNDEQSNDYYTQSEATWIINDSLFHIIQPDATLIELIVRDQTDPDLEIVIDFQAIPQSE